MCDLAWALSWHEKQALLTGEFTSVVPAASVLTPVAALKLKPAPYAVVASFGMYGDIEKRANSVAVLELFNVPEATVLNRRFGKADAEAEALKSAVPVM